MLGTLGDKAFPSTCSYAAAIEHFPEEEVVLFDTFEECIKNLKNKELDVVIIPAAYPSIAPIIMDDPLQIVQTFLYRIPDLVLAKKYDSSISASRLYFHPATESLLSKSDEEVRFKETIPVNSNTDAALKVKVSTAHDLCVTNELCAKQQDLEIVQILKKDLNMPFICFKGNDK